MQILRSLYDHMEWANQEVLGTLRPLPTAAPERARAVEIYAHLAAAEHVWLSRLRGRDPEHAVWPELDLDAAAELARESMTGLREVLRDAGGDAGGDGGRQEITYRNSAGVEFRSRIVDILAHVALHGSYHRGQLALLVRQAGGQPMNSDYIAWIRGAPAPGGNGPDGG